MPAHAFLVSYETFRSDFTDNPHSMLRQRVWDAVVLDEAQKIKNRDSEVAQKCKQIFRRRSYALTGTPLENSVDDLASIMEFITPFDSESERRFLIPGQQLLNLHKNLQLRRKKSEVLPQLPPKTSTDVFLPLQPEQQRTYEKAEKEGVLRLKENKKIPIEHVLELIMKLKQICNFCTFSNQSAKLLELHERLETLVAEDHRAIIFSQFADDRFGCRAIAASLEAWRPLVFTGDQSSKSKDAIIQEFKSNDQHKVMVLSLRAGGQGLNLQEASYVFHFDRWWNPAVERQAEDRSHRLGQHHPVHVYRYIMEDTIEERIDEILKAKQRLFDAYVDGVTIDLKSFLTKEEMLGLFGL